MELLEVEDRPKYGFAWLEGRPTEPLPFRPVCFVLNRDADMRGRLTLTTVESSVPDLTPEEVVMLDHPLNAFARSNDALRAYVFIGEEIPPGVRDNARQGTPEAQVWGPPQVTAKQIQVIMMEVVSADDQDLAHLRVVVERQGHFSGGSRAGRGHEMTQVLLCAGPGLLVVKKDGLLFFRRSEQPDTPVPYAPEHYPVFLTSARQKHGMAPVVGASGEEAPRVADEVQMPALVRERLVSGEEVYRLQPVGETCEDGNRAVPGTRHTPLTT